MNKKVVFGLFGAIVVIFLISYGVVVGQMQNNYSPAARTVKKLIEGRRKNFAQITTFGYEVDFAQKYGDYSGEGKATLSVYMDNPVEKLSVTDMINNGRGYLQVEQKENGLDYNYAVKVDSRELFITISKNGITGLNARIDKHEFTESVAPEKIDEDYDKLLFMDAWKDIRKINELSAKLLRELDIKDARVLNEFVEKHDIKIDYEETGYRITFKFNTDGLLDEAVKISGNVLIDKDNYNLSSYEYDLTEYLSKRLENTEITEYKIKGQSVGQTFGLEVEINDPIKRYHASNISEFTEQFNANLIQK